MKLYKGFVTQIKVGSCVGQTDEDSMNEIILYSVY